MNVWMKGDHSTRAWIASAFTDGYRAGLLPGFITGMATAGMIALAPFPHNAVMAALGVIVILAFHSWGSTATSEKNETVERVLWEMRHDVGEHQP